LTPSHCPSRTLIATLSLHDALPIYYDVRRWLSGDPAGPPPPDSRRNGRNHDWTHLDNMDVISMPDTWEYPWYAAWDLAFHCVALDRKSTRLNSSHGSISYAVFCLTT